MAWIPPLTDPEAPEGSRSLAAVLYLAGDGARYVTGTTLVIDAGLLTG